MRERQDEIDQLGAAVVVVTFESPDQVRRWAAGEPFPYPVFSDPARHAYAAFGLRRGRLRQIWSRSTIAFYARSLIRGHWPRWPHGDVGQLGGDFVLDAGGQVIFAYRSVDPADRPPVGQLLSALQMAAGEQYFL